MAVRATQTGTKVVTGKVRTSFVNLFQPRADDNGNLKYSVMLLIPKSDKATLKALADARSEALEQGTQKFGKAFAKGAKNTLHDCDEVDDLEQYPEREGHFRISVSANEAYKPGVVDQNLDPILDATEIYSGCYVRASLSAFPYSTSGNKGVSFGLRNVQKLADGDPLGGVSRAEDDFESLAEDDEDIY